MFYDTFGQELVFGLRGGSHCESIGGFVRNFPSGVTMDWELLKEDIDRRRPVKYGTPRKETDKVEFSKESVSSSGEIGSEIVFEIKNKNIDSSSYNQNENLFRPSHVDYVYYKKYGMTSLEYKDRASGRNTLPMVVGGCLCKMFLKKFDISFQSEVVSHGDLEFTDKQDTIGGVVGCSVKNVPIGLGEPFFEKVQSKLAYAMMSIPSATGFEIGEGFARTGRPGSRDIDNWVETGEGVCSFKTSTNRCGGVNAGISNGNDLIFRVGFHPVHSLEKSMGLMDKSGKVVYKQYGGRHDKAHIFRLPVVVEAMAAMVIADLILMNKK